VKFVEETVVCAYNLRYNCYFGTKGIKVDVGSLDAIVENITFSGNTS
jgi:hypothetical protein